MDSETPKTPVKRGKRRAVSAARKADASGTASIMVEVVSGLGESLIGPEGALLPSERMLIEDPLSRIIARSDPKKMGQYVDLLDPLLLGVGIVLYAARINKLVNPPKPTQKQPTLSQQLKATPDTDPSPSPVLRQNLNPVGAG